MMTREDFFKGEICGMCKDNPATECWEDTLYCDTCFAKLQDYGEYLADLAIHDRDEGPLPEGGDKQCAI